MHALPLINHARTILSRESRLLFAAGRRPAAPPWVVAVGFALLGALIAPLPASATMLVKRMELREVTDAAERIVHGRVTALRSGRDSSGIPSTWVTVDISDTVKGKRLRRFTFKQFGVSEPLVDGAVTGMFSMPRYHVGEEVVLFLPGKSPRGFRSPVGLGQGLYRVSGSGSAAQVQSDLPKAPPRKLTDFLSEVRRHAAAR